MKRLLAVAAALAVALPLAAATKQVLSDVYRIDKKYKSMEGPAGIQTVYLGDQDKPELIWVTGIKTEVVGEDGTTFAPQELMCHLNVEIDPAKHKALFNLKRYPASRLMTLSQGIFSMKTPDGYAFPMASIEPLIVYTQVLNHNIEQPNGMKVRHRVTFEYVRDADLTTPMKPLFNAGASGVVLLNDNPIALASTMDMPNMTDQHGMEHHSAADCLVGMRAPNAAGMASDYVDPKGRKVTGHWIVPPGVQTNHSDITWFMSLPYDTKLHYAVAHLHPFAKSLTLIDDTTGQTIWSAHAEGPKEGIGLAHVDTFASEKGVPMYREHKYELISVYNNTSGKNQDSMASMFFGFDDPEFVKPTPAELADRLAESSTAMGIVVRTTAGDFAATLLRDQAPAAVAQFTRLVHAGALKHAAITSSSREINIAAPIADDLRPLLKRFTAADRGLSHQAGMLSICPSAADAKEVSVQIELFPAPSRDDRCTPFARLGPGGDVIRTIAQAPANATISVEKIDFVDDHGAAGALAPARPVAASSR
jgi:cyclophilin family peptidyl-prolyl cis-trans isomerase